MTRRHVRVVVPTRAGGDGAVPARRGAAACHPRTIAFATTVPGASAASWAGIWTVCREVGVAGRGRAREDRL
jgi:hypothetical protein